MIAFIILALAFFGSIYIFYKILNHFCNRKNHFRIMYNSESYCYYVQKKLWGAWWHWNVFGNFWSIRPDEWDSFFKDKLENYINEYCINPKKLKNSKLLVKEIYGDIKN